MIKPWFLTEGKFAAELIIPSSWGSQLDGEKPSTPCRISSSQDLNMKHMVEETTI
jgi:hypothetical protein